MGYDAAGAGARATPLTKAPSSPPSLPPSTLHLAARLDKRAEGLGNRDPANAHLPRWSGDPLLFSSFPTHFTLTGAAALGRISCGVRRRGRASRALLERRAAWRVFRRRPGPGLFFGPGQLSSDVRHPRLKPLHVRGLFSQFSFGLDSGRLVCSSPLFWWDCGRTDSYKRQTRSIRGLHRTMKSITGLQRRIRRAILRVRNLLGHRLIARRRRFLFVRRLRLDRVTARRI